MEIVYKDVAYTYYLMARLEIGIIFLIHKK